MNHSGKELLEQLLDGRSLSESTAHGLMCLLTDETLPPARAGALLGALRAKGETAAEIRGFATALRELATKPVLPAELQCMDIVGTGGDNSGSYNLSTGTALLAAASGIPVAKHGNRSVSSKSGSADMLAELGLPMPMDAERSGECLRATNFTFFFAPFFHPAMKAVARVRIAMGVRTVFNFLGPLCNPAAPPLHLIGAYSEAAAKLMADTLAGMEQHRSFIVHGEPGWDEATPVGEFVLFDVKDGTVTREVRTPEDYGVARCTANALTGGDATHNAKAMEAVFSGADKGAHRDALLMGASLALELAGKVESPQQGVELAASTIDSGKASALVQKIREFASA